ncbi:hypothetical protein PACTADRAFT_49582 [Pachysolen tannophilus NRRL Y-2460]|uniref:Exocyst complex component EXO84 n=1 Tax=Pachysolen tannophilus NRRL Y-2460 TaxID=669874 RepID=A0A1E4TWS9_PACTA|nr:hypothetical protein PACTADRAFT_49582 [Pachysolen tannophilus NRRL Y-2460]
MVDVSMRKSRAPKGDWRNIPKSNGETNNANPYAGLTSLGRANYYNNGNNINDSINDADTSGITINESGGDLQADNIDKARVHRRFSVRLNGPQQADLTSHLQHPLPMNSGVLVQQQAQQAQQLQQPQQRQQQWQQQMQPKQQSSMLLPPQQFPAQASSSSPSQAQTLTVPDLKPAHKRRVSASNVQPDTNDEFAMLLDANLDAKRFVADNLSNATAIKIDEFTKKLNNLNIKVDENIKEVINQSLENLLKTSRDLVETENDIKNLKLTFNELNDTIQSMKQSAESVLTLAEDQVSSPSKIGRKPKRDRSSVLVVQKLWDRELRSLFNHVAGAQQLISPSPGRHIVAESGRWYEVSSTTWKPLQSAHIFLLNDLIMIATRKRPRNDESENGTNGSISKSQSLVASQCWPLRDVKLFDLKKSSRSKNNDGDRADFFTITIQYNSMKYVYQTDRYDHYDKVITHYRKAKDELRNLLEIEQEKSQIPSRTTSMNQKKSFGKEKRSSGILSSTHSRSKSLDILKDAAISGIKSLDDHIDELDINIARHKYDRAVTLFKYVEDEVNKYTNKIDMNNQLEESVQLLENLKSRLRNRKEIIKNNIIREFEYDKISKEAIIDYVSLLKNLDLLVLGRTCFLNSRTKLINNLISKVEIDGNIPQYITQISIIRFQIIKSAVLIFQEMFADEIKEETCFLIDWCFNEVKDHVKFLNQQLHGVNSNSTAFEKSIKVIQRQVENLKNIGVDVEFLLDDFYHYFDKNQ